MSTSVSGIDWSQVCGELPASDCVLLLHGLDSSPKTIEAVTTAVVGELQRSYVMIPKLPLAWHSCVDLRGLAEELLDHLTGVLAKHREFRQVFLVGHSIGGVLAQAVFLLAYQRLAAERMRDAVSDEDKLLRQARLVLIAPLSRGWALSHHLPLGKKLAWATGLALMPFVKTFERVRSVLAGRDARPPWILQARRWSPFLVWLRMSWLDFHEQERGKPDNVVQLLGSVDELVSWRDMVDTAAGGTFVYLPVPHSDHVAILDFDEEDGLGEDRKCVFKLALGDLEKAKAKAIEPWDVDPLPPNRKVKRVVFVIHGIRDEGHWTQKIAATAKRAYVAEQGPADEIEAVTSSYGYFSMLQFLRPRERHEKVAWLVEEYVEAKRRFPCAKFSFIGHSNGTYLAAQAMADHPEVRFERLALAGSVLSQRFPWHRFGHNGAGKAGGDRGESKQVRWVLNYGATRDWVVGIFPRIADLLPLRWLLGPDLGGAGVAGFPGIELAERKIDSTAATASGDDRQPSRDAGNREPAGTLVQVQTVGYRKGQHSAAIEEANWWDLATFAVGRDVTLPLPRPEGYSKKPSWPFDEPWGPVTCLLGWAFVVTVVAFLGWLSWNWPWHFWLTPLLLAVVAVLGFTLVETWSTGAELRTRRRLRKALHRGLLASLIATAAAWVALLWLSPMGSMLGTWSAESRGGTRMLSLVFYLWTVHRLLTRV